MAYNRYNEKDTTKTKNGGNYNQKMVFKNEGSKNKTGKKSHDETVKQMQMLGVARLAIFRFSVRFGFQISVSVRFGF